MTSPGFFVGNSTTMATTPLPNRMRTNVPRNSATSSAAKPGFEVIASPSETAYVDREVVYQARGPARLIFFDLGRNRGPWLDELNPLPRLAKSSVTRDTQFASVHRSRQLTSYPQKLFWGKILS